MNGSAVESQEPSELELALRDAEAKPIQQYEPQSDLSEAMTCRTLAGMTDHQLEYYVSRSQELVIEAEKALEVRRQRLAAGKLEQRERNSAKQRQRRPRTRQKKADYGQSIERIASRMMETPPKPSESGKPTKQVTSTKDWLERHHGRIR